MKNICKRTLSFFISIILAVTVFSIAAVSTVSAAAPAYFVADAGDSLDHWHNLSGGDSVMYLDTENKVEGTASVKIDLPAEGTNQATYFAMKSTLTFDNPISINTYPYCEVMVYLDRDLPTNAGLQINIVDTNIAGENGWDYNCSINNHAAGWFRETLNITADDQKIPSCASASRDNITKMRFSWLLYCDYYEADFSFDNVIYFNQEFKAARTAEESRVKELVSNLTVPTQENYTTVKAALFTAVDAVKQAKTNYPNFLIENQTTLDSDLASYYQFAKAGETAATEQLITGIGDVTATNYTEKLADIEAAEASVKNLKDVYGDDVDITNIAVLKAARTAYTEQLISSIGEITATNYTGKLTAIEAAEAANVKLTGLYGNTAVPSNKAILEAARTSYNGFKTVDDDKAAAAVVVAEINALPEPADLVLLTDEPKVVAARTHYDALTDAQEDYIPAETVAVLVAAEKKIASLKYTLGDIDENGSVTANDALLALQHSVQKITLEGNKLLAADVDGNSKITANDALLILQYSVHKITKFPADKD